MLLECETHKFQKIVENEKVTIMGNFICAKVPRLASSESYIQSRITSQQHIYINIGLDSTNLKMRIRIMIQKKKNISFLCPVLNSTLAEYLYNYWDSFQLLSAIWIFELPRVSWQILPS